MRRAAVIATLLVVAIAFAACDSCGSAADGGGGTIVIGGCAPQQGAPPEDFGEPILDVATRIVDIKLDAGFSLTDVAAPAAVSAVSSAVVGLDHITVFAAPDCGATWSAYVSRGPIILFAGQQTDDALEAVRIPAGARICAASLTWSGGRLGVPSFTAAGTLTSGTAFYVESMLRGGISRVFSTDSSAVRPASVLLLGVDPSGWLAPLSAGLAGSVTNDSLYAVSPTTHSDVLADIESLMNTEATFFLAAGDGAVP